MSSQAISNVEWTPTGVTSGPNPERFPVAGEISAYDQWVEVSSTHSGVCDIKSEDIQRNIIFINSDSEG